MLVDVEFYLRDWSLAKISSGSSFGSSTQPRVSAKALPTISGFFLKGEWQWAVKQPEFLDQIKYRISSIWWMSNYVSKDFDLINKATKEETMWNSLVRFVASLKSSLQVQNFFCQRSAFIRVWRVVNIKKFTWHADCLGKQARTENKIGIFG